ncbi:MAG: hypothetical protein ACRD50_15400 [Candidatus Acidiferrales bacterium]
MELAQYEGTIEILRMWANCLPVFNVGFQPYSHGAANGASSYRSFREMRHLKVFLAALGIRKGVISQALERLARGISTSIPNVTLSEKVLRDQGLDSTVSLKRRTA